MDLPLQTIAQDALGTFPPIGNDRDSASNYAQRMLTKHISELRKSGQDVSDEGAQEQRQLLDKLVNSLEVTRAPNSPPIPNTDKTENAKPDTPLHMEQLTTVISSCFHTPTDGSAKHLAVLRSRARGELNRYINNVDLGWAAKRHLKSKGKALINMHMKGISMESGNIH